MIDFLTISTRSTKRGVIEVYPKFIIKKSSDLMIRGGDFYAIWIESRGLWSTDEDDAVQLIDMELDAFVVENKDKFDAQIKALHMWDAESGMIDIWHKYCQKQLRDSYVMLDENLVFANDITSKKDFASKKLPYPLEAGNCEGYDRLLQTLYTPEERHKIEWAIGAVIAGDSKYLQKFMVLYGSAGTGKSTVLNIVQQLFEGYYSVFDAKALGSSSNVFALEAFKTNPLVAIQHDGDLSHIEDNTRLNSLVSHELMTVNEKFKSTYANRFKSFLFIGTNKPVKITDAKSGLIRRLIDVSPSGNKVNAYDYEKIMANIKFELGAIAFHCRAVYRANRSAYENYIPVIMLGASNDFYNFVMDSYLVFKKEDSVTLKAAWEMYKTYCDEAKVPYPFSQRVFKEELRSYFQEYYERYSLADGTRVRSYYISFRADRFDSVDISEPVETIKTVSIVFKEQESILDISSKDFIAQYASDKGTPLCRWGEVTTKLRDLDTKCLHYVKLPENHIVIDFDIVGEDGKKSYEKNLEEASKWPKTYAELSKSGAGIHLHYLYSGDATKLSRIYEDRIEIKVFTGNASLRRKLTKCNNEAIATISSGLPLKGETKMVNFTAVQSEKGLRTLIKRNLNKEFHAGTKPSMDFIHKILEDAYNGDLSYDISDMEQVILVFALNSTNQSEYCLKLMDSLKLKSEKDIAQSTDEGDYIVFYDVEIFPNLFLVNWKMAGEGKNVVRMINPKPAEIEALMKHKLVGFNCRRYDNHMLYGRLIGYSNEQLYDLSQKIINGEKGCFFGEAYNISYTDVYDFSSKKQSLKKFEIELGIHHQELGLPWDQPVPEEMWFKVAEYCDNDVIATEAVFNARQSDFLARQILADLAGSTVNDTTNSLSTRIIFAGNRTPQDQFQYRDMGLVTDTCSRTVMTKEDVLYTDFGDEYTMFDELGRPVFPGYKYAFGKSTYRDELVGEGGYVYSEPGMYTNVALLDIASMHPSSVVAENLFGDLYTSRFKDILDARIAIKHKDFEKARTMLNGALARHLTDESVAGDLASALKIVINSVYGLTSAKFDNPFRDIRNVDNIVAKRGALFMINLKHAVQDRGFTVAHVKTDSIKIPNATPEIIEFVMDYGKQYGYNFEHEATYDRMCLVNDAVYIAKYDNGKWTATGAQFQVPYVFKTLFSKDPIVFSDMCETKAVTGNMYIDISAEDDDEHDYHFIGRVGRFCPVKGCGGTLYREKDGKYSAVTGTKGYHWMESEMVEQLQKQDSIDKSYHTHLVDEAVKSISAYGDFEWFTA